MGECHIGEQDDSFQLTPGAIVQSDKVVVGQEPLKLLKLSELDRHSCEIDKPFPLSCNAFPAFTCSRLTFMRVVGSIEFGIGLPKKCNLQSGGGSFLIVRLPFQRFRNQISFFGISLQPWKIQKICS